MKKWIILAGFALLGTPLFGQQPSENVGNDRNLTSKNDSLRSLSELSDVWNTLRPGGATICAQGSEYLFFARVADPSRLVVYLHGGGGCWNAETCDPGRDSSTYSSKVEPQRYLGEQSGIFDLDNPENPVTDFYGGAAGDFEKAVRVTKLAFYLAHAMATDPQRPNWTDEGWAEIKKLIELNQPN